MADKPLEEQQTPFLLRLPPSLLRLVLLDPLKPISFKNFIICKTLLPYTLEALYNHVSLVKRGSFAKFDACTKARPAVIELIKSFTVETRCLSKESTSRTSTTLRDNRRVKSPRRPPADLLDLMFNLPNLKVLVLGSKETAREVLLDPRQSTADLDAAWPRLRQVTLQITRYEPAEPSDCAVLLRVVSLRSLRSLRLVSTAKQRGDFPPLPVLDLSPTTALSPRSLNLVELDIDGLGSAVYPEYRTLFAACSDSLRSFRLTAGICPTSVFSGCLAVLPPFLRTLSLCVGHICPHAHLNPPDGLPAVDSILSFFPLLERLSIYSDVLSYTSSLGALKNLKHLSLGPHSRLVPAELVKLLPPTLPRLHSIASQLCTCPAETLPPRTRCSIPGTKEGTADPETRRWVEEGEALLRKAAQTGVEIEGELRCSLGMCRVTKEHEAVCVGNGL